ncbi:hypothetical protein [Halomonas sp. LBP4]|uniref:hypothetical protein n=1 Tax=Halomonas sp. LBP4 TaxID=2044917 RepID=UPI000D76DF3E|nr:hypothetical protein [Halomonas sp. LBP4]PXX99909.1 hypothetical protein CR157_03865 [Halomonas sp. LBP4]
MSWRLGVSGGLAQWLGTTWLLAVLTATALAAAGSAERLPEVAQGADACRKKSRWGACPGSPGAIYSQQATAVAG